MSFPSLQEGNSGPTSSSVYMVNLPSYHQKYQRMSSLDQNDHNWSYQHQKNFIMDHIIFNVSEILCSLAEKVLGVTKEGSPPA